MVNVSVFLFGLTWFAGIAAQKTLKARLTKTNSILLDTIDALSAVHLSLTSEQTDHWLVQGQYFDQDVTTDANELPMDPEGDLGPAAHCMELKSLPISYEDIDEQYPCLRPLCNSITTPEECRSNTNFYHGCSWCAGSCQPYKAFNDAFITCVRAAYEDFEPGKVNGKVPVGNPSLSEFGMEWANTAYGTEQQGSHWFYGRMRWSDNEDKRLKGDRVPIHVHPFPGLSCITTFDATPTIVWAEGEEPFDLPSGTCYSMPPMKKLGPQSPGGYSVKDTFVYDTCYPLWVVIEPGATHIQDGQFAYESDLKCCGTEICPE